MPARRPPRSSNRTDGRKSVKILAPGSVPARRIVAVIGLTALGVVVVIGGIVWERDRPRRLLDAAEAATLARDWPSAATLWNRINQTRAANARTLLAEASAELAIDRGADADRALERASTADPGRAEAWRARLDRFRVLDQPVEALKLLRRAETSVAPAEFRPILASATLAALAELPDDEARERLDRWIKADPNDFDARVAWLDRVAANPHPGDPDRATRIRELTAILDRDPNQIAARETLLVALADAGEPEKGRTVLAAWPEASRDARYFRLRARWDLEYDHQPEQAVVAYTEALNEIPHDWTSHYGLARAYRALGRETESRNEANIVARLRERLAPATLAPRLTGDLAKLDDPRSSLDLAALCQSVGLTWLAESWAREARLRPSARGPLPTDR